MRTSQIWSLRPLNKLNLYELLLSAPFVQRDSYKAILFPEPKKDKTEGTRRGDCCHSNLVRLPLWSSHGQNRIKRDIVRNTFWWLFWGVNFVFFCSTSAYVDLLYNLYSETFMLHSLIKELQNRVKTATSHMFCRL